MTTSPIRPSSEPALSHHDWRLLVEAIEDFAIFMLDPQGRVVSWNRGAEAIKGYRPSEILGRHFSVFYPEETRPGADDQLELVRREGRLEREGWCLRKDGSRFWADVVITALRDEHGQLRGFAKVTRDLTQRRAADEELRRSEERMRLLIDAVTDYAIYMLDPEGRVTTWNPGAQRLKGYTAAEILGQSYARFFTQPDAQAGKPERELEIARTEGHFAEEGLRVRKDGTQFWASVVLTPIRGAGGVLVGFAKVTRDLTARLQADETTRELVREQTSRAIAQANEARLRESEERYRAAAKRAEEANRLKDEFLATLSHELRTPLNAILGWASVLRSTPLEASAVKAVEVIHRNAYAQAKIIDDLLDVSRIITGKLRMELAPTDLVTIVRDAIEVVRPSALAKQISLTFAPPVESCVLLADRERLQQVLWNLLSNAVKFSHSGASVRVELQLGDGVVKLHVDDTGQGIEPEFLPFVFERFRQADSSATRRFGGLGLGLAIVRYLVELHGGEVSADSAGKDRGASFTVTLPMRAPPATSAPPSPGDPALAAEQRPSAARSGLAGRRVLVVDDEADARELVTAVLSEAGAVVESAASAAEALAVLPSFRPHVLVSDIGMPGEDGYAFIRRVNALDAAAGGGVPSLALTAYARNEDRATALAMGFTTHLSKPVQPDDLVAAVANLAAFVHR